MTEHGQGDGRRRLDDVARALQAELQVRIALVSTFEGGRHFFVGAAGLPPELEHLREIPLIESFCAYVHDHGGQLIVDEVAAETRVAAHPLIAELGIHAYAGWHITGGRGETVGVLSAMDDRPRAWTPRELITLMDRAHACAPAVLAAIAEG